MQPYSPVICLTTTSRIRIDTQRRGLQGDGVLQGLKQGNVFGDVVVLAADPLGNPDFLSARVFDHHPNAGGPGLPCEPPST